MYSAAANVSHAVTIALREAVGRLAWFATRTCWASDLIASARADRRFRTALKAHQAAGGVVVVRQRRGLRSVSLEG